MRQQGFTLVELMIVIAIIGILSAIALPAYQDYTRRSRVAEGLNLTGQAKAAVVEYYGTNGSWPTSNSVVGIASASDITGDGVTSVAIGSGGKITITFNARVDDGKTLVMTPSNQGGFISWTCSGGTLDDRYRPSSCR